MCTKTIWSRVSIDTLHRHSIDTWWASQLILGQHLIDISVGLWSSNFRRYAIECWWIHTSRSTRRQLSINCWSSVDRVLIKMPIKCQPSVNWVLIEILIECQLRCWSSIEQVLIENDPNWELSWQKFSVFLWLERKYTLLSIGVWTGGEGRPCTLSCRNFWCRLGQTLVIQAAILWLVATHSHVCLAKMDLKSSDIRDLGILFWKSQISVKCVSLKLTIMKMDIISIPNFPSTNQWQKNQSQKQWQENQRERSENQRKTSNA